MALSESLNSLGDPVRPGDSVKGSVTAGRINGIISAIRALARGDNLINGPGILLKRSPAGVTITSTARAEIANTFFHPFQIKDTSDDDGPAVTVRYGTVQDVAPTDVSTSLGLADGDGTYSVYIELTIDVTDPFAITATELFADLGSMPADSDTTAHVLLGEVVVTDGAIADPNTDIQQAATHSLRFQACGRAEAIEGVEATEFDPGTPDVPFNPGTYQFWGF